MVYDDFYIVNKTNIIKESKFITKKKLKNIKSIILLQILKRNINLWKTKSNSLLKLIKVNDAKKVMILSNKTFDKFFRRLIIKITKR